MDLRHTMMKGRRALSALAITAGLLLTVAGCGGGGDAKSGKQAPTSSSAGTRVTARRRKADHLL